MRLTMLGVFDSGFGGLTVLKAIHARLPYASTLYLGDNARAPYGMRTHDEIFAFALEGVRELFRRGCPLVILACNTASAQALRQIQQEILPAEFPDRRVLGVIRPTAEAIVTRTKTGRVGVFATPATVGSGAYVREIADASGRVQGMKDRVRIKQVACPGLVELIESGRAESDEADAIIGTCAEKMLEDDPAIDTVLLGCTHYPLVERTFRRHLPPEITIVTQGAIVADSLADYLSRHPNLDAHLARDGRREYLTTKNDEGLSSRASAFYGGPLRLERVELGRAGVLNR